MRFEGCVTLGRQRLGFGLVPSDVLFILAAIGLLLIAALAILKQHDKRRQRLAYGAGGASTT
jgi:hypothetical protein